MYYQNIILIVLILFDDIFVCAQWFLERGSNGLVDVVTKNNKFQDDLLVMLFHPSYKKLRFETP